MEILFVGLIILVLAALILPWICMFKIGNIRDEIWRLQIRIKDLEETSLTGSVKTHQIKLNPSEIPTSSSAPAIETVHPKTAPEPKEHEQYEEYEEFDKLPDEPEPQWQCTQQTAQQIIPETSTKSSGFEWNFGTRLPVWIGSVSLACAAFFLVKYSIEIGLLGPLARVIIGGLFGAGLIASGTITFNRPSIANHIRIGKGITGAGILSIAFSLYAAVHMYGLIPPLAGFAGMAALTVITILLSLKMGEAIALFGIIGGFLTPALFGTDQASLNGLLSYLFVFYAGLQTVMIRRGWHKLSYLSIAGLLIWSLIAMLEMKSTQAGISIPLFLMATSIFTMFSLRTDLRAAKDESTPADRLSMLTLGGSAGLIFILHHVSALNLFDWSVMGLTSAALLALAYLRPSTYSKTLWAKAGLDLLLFLLDADTASLAHSTTVAGGLLLLYGGVPHFIMRRGKIQNEQEKHWAGLQIVSSLLLLVIAKFTINLPDTLEKLGIWGEISLLATIYSGYQLRFWWQQKKNDYISGLYTVAATSFLSLGLALEIPHTWLPVAFTAEAAALYALQKNIRIDILPKLSLILTILCGGFYLEQGGTMILMALDSIFDSHHRTPAILLQTSGLLATYLIPAAFLAAAYIFKLQNRATDKNKPATLYILSGFSLLLTSIAAYILLRHIGTGDPQQAANWFDRALVTLFFAMTGLLLHAGTWTRNNIPSLSFWGSFLILLALSRVAFFDFLQLNPFTNASQTVGNFPLLNGITLTFGTGLALSLYARKRSVASAKIPALIHIYKFTTMAFLLALISLNIRQIFVGPVLAGHPVSPLEMYCYSAIWLMTGLGLLAYGIKFRDQTVRFAALGFLTLTIGKVFLVDAANLQGIYRILSFFGLGVSLIGLSVFYTRYMTRYEKKDK